jgi:hypothetical protein
LRIVRYENIFGLAQQNPRLNSDKTSPLANG